MCVAYIQYISLTISDSMELTDHWSPYYMWVVIVVHPYTTWERLIIDLQLVAQARVYLARS